ncbi:hypothetical protein M9Y10_024641 [Tritrichomonas musculus]|uniref:ABC transporter domain-containing protein n=1 Tax=Tritrichomonas musculus TaxID=1915356 RepID=A0ABR2HBU0_9EUKA
MASFAEICPINHLKAILYRRYITFKRLWKSIITSLIITAALSALGIAVYYMMVGLDSINNDPITFNSYSQNVRDFVIVGDHSKPLAKDIIQKLETTFIEQTGRNPNFVHFNSTSQMQQTLYDMQSKQKLSYLIPFGLDFTKEPTEIIIFANSTTNEQMENPHLLRMYSFVLVGQALWELQYQHNYTLINTKNTPSSISFNFIRMNKNKVSSVFQALCPTFLLYGLLTYVLLIIATPISDIRGEVRTYMVQCTLKIFPYWLGAFIVDLGMWIILTTIVWCIFNLAWVKPFHENLFPFWWILVCQGPSFLLSIYSFSFCFHDPSTGPRQIFIILLIANFVVMVVTLIIKTTSYIDPSAEKVLNWIYALIPNLSIQQGTYLIMQRTGLRKMSFGQYFKDKETRPFFIMQWANIVFYASILTFIEVSRQWFQRAAAKHSFSSYADYFRRLKELSHKSPETRRMEEEVRNSHDWVVRIEDVSRLFINTAGNPIPAVNNVCLGIKNGSCFGFLGANGAGKTTLMRMITGTLPKSAGSIEIFGTPIEEITDKTIISICPQFNTHLLNELTPNEHFKIYSWIFQKDPEEAKKQIDSLISELELAEFQDIPIRELSVGDVRKFAIALSFFGPSRLLLLDEPTAFLDPVSCRCVQEMILEHKGEKTFMLCTHILSEAELLCDIISIMVRGNVYTVGTPQHLTQKFGTEYKIDIMLDDASEKSANKIDDFFSKELPFANLDITRPVSRIYSVPASKIKMSSLFLLLEKGQNEDNGYKYFTCSTSSLERVFMEIVRISEQEDAQSTRFESLNSIEFSL